MGARVAGSSGSSIQKYATPLATALFAVVGVSGVLVFFHLGGGSLKGLHEWLGLAFVAAALLHVARNWNGFVKIVKTRRTQVLIGLTGIATAAFLMISGQGGGNPMKAFVFAAAEAPLPQVAQVLNVPTDRLLADLKAQGFTVTDPTQSLAQIAKASKRDVPEAFGVLMSAKN